MAIAERHVFVPDRVEGETVLFDTKTKVNFTIKEFEALIEGALKDAFPKAGVVECFQMGPDKRMFLCHIGGYALTDGEPYLDALKTTYDVAAKFRLATNMFVTQLNGWSFTLEIV